MSRPVPRFSLLTILLLMALAACTITIWQLWREIAPLRAEVRRLRTEVGQLTIEDPKKAYAIRVQTFEENTWKWRIYLPPGRSYAFYQRSGHLPSPIQNHSQEWIQAAQRHSSGSSTVGTDWGGEFLLEAKVVQEDDRWLLVTRHVHRDGTALNRGGGTTSIYPDKWLSDRFSPVKRSDVPTADQRAFEPDEPILILHCMKPLITESNGGYSSRMPESLADGFALWIEPQASDPQDSTTAAQ